MSQHMNALARANEVRLARAALKRQIGQGQVTVAEVLRDMPWEAEGMTVYDLLIAQHRWAEMRTNRLLNSAAISPLRPVGRLTERQKLRITYRLHMSPSELRIAA